ncbi:hypothetical protein DEU56DRAFT_902894 [Suillus clintonianus]|uniref:uncharacterized protein n=1 Tax=Suillus clintonianus TaxID=1904413 RepID=UPI001B882520|nr:uncharacterized protein DEU56DRAFT_902894 [Suillus clintonianus]KAG2129472.1 hypothetical protein DEU56DRAFT_902894 [Suillus clintonianus]
MPSIWKLFVTAKSTSKRGSPVLPETLATAASGVEPGSSNETPSSEGPVLLQSNPTTVTTSASGNGAHSSEASTDTSGLVLLQSNPTAVTTSMTSDSSYSSEASTDTSGSATPRAASTNPTPQTTSTSPPGLNAPDNSQGEDIDCVLFDSNAYIGSPTINFDSEDATGATNLTPDDTFQPQRPPSAVAYPQMTQARRRERVTHFGPGTVVGSPTINIRSKRVSGAMDTVVPSRKQNY